MSDQNPWVEKYRPETKKEYQGNNKALDELMEWVDEYDQHDQSMLLIGDPGVGKSTAVHVIGNELDLPVKEINASDSRTKEDIQEAVSAARAQPISADKQIVFFDEADSISGRTSLTPLYDLVDQGSNPIIFAANNEYEVPSGIKSRSETKKFRLGKRSIKAKLKDIIEAEGLEIGAATLSTLSERNSLRDAIQDLQAISEGRQAFDDEREYDDSIFDEIERVIRGKPTGFSENPEKVIDWIDKNLRDEYRLTEAHMAWSALARADEWLGRSNPPNFEWWGKAAELERQVPHLRLTDAYDGYIPTNSPDVYSKGWTKTEKNLYERIQSDDATNLTCDFTEFRKLYLPILKDELEEADVQAMRVRYGLSDEMVELLGGDSSIEPSDVSVDEKQEPDEGSFMEW